LKGEPLPTKAGRPVFHRGKKIFLFPVKTKCHRRLGKVKGKTKGKK